MKASWVVLAALLAFNIACASRNRSDFHRIGIGHQCAHQACAEIAAGAVQIADLG